MTSSSELEDIINKLKIKTPFRGVMMKDELKNMVPMNYECGIVNLNSSDVTTAENNKTGHWIAYFRKNKNNYHFCSYGSPPPNILVEYLNKPTQSPIHSHTFQIQDFGETVCGELAVLFLHLMDKDLDYSDVVLNILRIRQYSDSHTRVPMS